MRIGEGVDGTDDAAAREERAENAEKERGENQPDVPDLHHAALFLHHDGVKESGASEPRKQRSVFDRIPAPIATPTENGVGPMSAEKNAEGLEAPGDHGPFAGEVNPLFAGITSEQSGEGKCERNGETGVAGIEVGRMNDHFRILEERIEAVAVHAGERFEDAAGVDGGEGLEGILDEVVEGKKENLNAGENHADVGHQFAVLVTIGEKNGDDVDGEEGAPEEERAFLASPESSNFVEGGEIAVGMLRPRRPSRSCR